MENTSLGKKVKSLRKMRGISQNQLAKKVGVKQATLSRLEAGLAKQMKSEALARVATALGVTTDYLFGNADKVRPEDLSQDDLEAKALLEHYLKMSYEDKKVLSRFAEFLAKGRDKR